jgi:hypothetical protein
MQKEILILLTLILVLTPLAYAQIIWDETDTSIVIDSKLPICQRTDSRETTGWIEPNLNNESVFSGSSFEDCYRENAESSNKGCCPDGYSCDFSSKKCIYSGLQQTCSEYTKQTSCNLYAPGIAEYDIETTKELGNDFCNKVVYSQDSNCSYLTICRCYWDAEIGCDSDWYYNDTCD